MPTYRRYSGLSIGEVLPADAVRFEVTEMVARAYAIATSDPGYGAGRSGFVPPMIAAVYVPAALSARNGPPGGVHAKQRFTFHRAPRIGDVLYTQGIVREKFEKKGRKYYVIETSTRDREGDLVTSGVTTGIWGPED